MHPLSLPSLLTIVPLILIGACKPPIKEAARYELDYTFAACTKLEGERCKENDKKAIEVKKGSTDIYLTFLVNKLSEERAFVVERCEVYSSEKKATATACQLASMIVAETDEPKPYTSKIKFLKPLAEGTYILKITLESGGRVYMYWPDVKVVP